MAQPIAPTPPRRNFPFVTQDGRLSPQGMMMLEQLWRQVAAGFVIVPAAISGTNDLTIVPSLSKQGAASYGEGMAWFGKAAATSTGAVTGTVTDGVTALASVKVYVNDGAAQAGVGDLVGSSWYLFIYAASLDSGAGGLVVK